MTLFKSASSYCDVIDYGAGGKNISEKNEYAFGGRCGAAYPCFYFSQILLEKHNSINK